MYGIHTTMLLFSVPLMLQAMLTGDAQCAVGRLYCWRPWLSMVARLNTSVRSKQPVTVPMAVSGEIIC